MSRRRPRTISVVISGLVLIIVVLGALYAILNSRPNTEVRLNSHVLSVRLATTDAARKQGLSGVEKLAANGGILMVFQGDGIWGIWMKDMKIPLDIVWLNNEKKVITIVNDALPDLGTSKIFTPTEPARYVLEVPAGTVKNADIKVGDLATFTIKENQ